MCSNHSRVGLWFVIAIVVNYRGQSPRASSPVVVRNEVEASVETGLRLFVDHT